MLYAYLHLVHIARKFDIIYFFFNNKLFNAFYFVSQFIYVSANMRRLFVQRPLVLLENWNEE